MQLNEYAPLKKKVIRGSQVPYMTKILRKAIMKRSELKTKYLKNRTNTNKTLYKKQKNFCSKLYKKERKKYYHNLDHKLITDNKKFWETIKPFLSDKSRSTSQINIIDSNNNILSDDSTIAQSFSKFFKSAVNSLGIENKNNTNVNIEDFDNPVDIAIRKFENHPSIIKIRESIPENTVFEFSSLNRNDVYKEIFKLNCRKKGTFGNIPTSCLKEMISVCDKTLTDIWNNEIIAEKIFPDKLKLADVTPVHKKDDATNVRNYRPVSVLPSVSKVFERLLQSQISKYIENFLSPYLCGYRKGYSTQTALMYMIEKWKLFLDRKGYAGAVLMDLSKAFDTINHELLIAKLAAYGFSKDSLILILSYLSNRWQRVKINSSFSSWTELLMGVPQGSVLGPLLFNIYLNDLFFYLKDVCNFADDTTPFFCDFDLETVINKLEEYSEISITWFETNFMKMNPEKCHLLISGHRYELVFANIGENKIYEEKEVKLLGVTIDNELKFDKHVSDLCNKANRKLSALIRMASFLSFQKKKILFKSFVESQFKYNPLIWMFYGRKINNRINRLHERALRIVYDDYSSSFEELLEKDNSVCIHHQNIHRLMIEIYKIKYESYNSPLTQFLVDSNRSTTRNGSDFIVPSINTSFNGKNSLRYLGPIIWNSLPREIKNASTLSQFKSLIKKWKPNCPCRLCCDYIPNVGFVTLYE